MYSVDHMPILANSAQQSLCYVEHWLQDDVKQKINERLLWNSFHG